MDMSRNDNLGAILEQTAGMPRNWLGRLRNEVANRTQQKAMAREQNAKHALSQERSMMRQADQVIEVMKK